MHFWTLILQMRPKEIFEFNDLTKNTHLVKGRARFCSQVCPSHSSQPTQSAGAAPDFSPESPASQETPQSLAARIISNHSTLSCRFIIAFSSCNNFQII